METPREIKNGTQVQNTIAALIGEVGGEQFFRQLALIARTCEMMAGSRFPGHKDAWGRLSEASCDLVTIFRTADEKGMAS